MNAMAVDQDVLNSFIKDCKYPFYVIGGQHSNWAFKQWWATEDNKLPDKVQTKKSDVLSGGQWNGHDATKQPLRNCTVWLMSQFLEQVGSGGVQSAEHLVKMMSNYDNAVRQAERGHEKGKISK